MHSVFIEIVLWTNIRGTNLIIVGDIGLALKNMHSALLETFIKIEAHFLDTLYGMSNAIHRESLLTWKRIFLVRYTVSNAIPNTAV